MAAKRGSVVPFRASDKTLPGEKSYTIRVALDVECKPEMIESVRVLVRDVLARWAAHEPEALDAQVTVEDA